MRKLSFTSVVDITLDISGQSCDCSEGAGRYKEAGMVYRPALV